MQFVYFPQYSESWLSVIKSSWIKQVHGVCKVYSVHLYLNIIIEQHKEKTKWKTLDTKWIMCSHCLRDIANCNVSEVHVLFFMSRTVILWPNQVAHSVHCTYFDSGTNYDLKEKEKERNSFYNKKRIIEQFIWEKLLTTAKEKRNINFQSQFWN